MWCSFFRNGIGFYDTITGAWSLGEDDRFFTSQDILFGEDLVRGDGSQLPVAIVNNDGNSLILSHMVIAPVPEPATAALFAMGSLLIM